MNEVYGLAAQKMPAHTPPDNDPLNDKGGISTQPPSNDATRQLVLT